jgi:N-acetylneuraminic acid mutarotase
MPTARNWVSTAVVDGIIYAIGGTTGANFCSIVEAYDPMADKWSSKANIPLSAWGNSAVVDGKIYSFGWGITCGGNNVCSQAGVYEYDPILDTWTKKSDMPTTRMAISADTIDGKIYAVGGITTYNPFIKISNVEIYNPKNDTWDKGIDLINARAYHVSALIDGRIYIIGGADDVIEFPTVEVFDTGLSVSPQGRLASKWGEIKSN